MTSFATAPAFVVKTSRGDYRTHSVLLAIGRRGTPRKLGSAGRRVAEGGLSADRSRAVCRSARARRRRRRQRLEAAASIAESAGASVVLSYRGEAFDRAKQRNRERVSEAARSGRLKVLLNSDVRQISSRFGRDRAGRPAAQRPNDTVIVNAGGVLPSDFLRRIGIHVETKYGTA